MAFTLWTLFEATLLCLNAVCVLHEERFLAKSSRPTRHNLESRYCVDNRHIAAMFNADNCDCAVGWTAQQNIQGFGEPPTIKSQLLNLVRSIRTVARFPLIFLNLLTIIVKLVLG